MRTTVTLDPDVAESLKEYAHRTRTSFKAALNAALRRGLHAQESGRGARRRFRVVPHDGGFRPGVDAGKLAALADQLEAEAFARKARPAARARAGR
jgi:hypothetical protein